MRSFSIKEMERFSGIKAHTIRIWEQRYQLFTPQRTEGNTRLYGVEDLQLLLDIAILVNNGSRISTLAELTPIEIGKKIRVLTSEQDRHLIAINHLIIYKHGGDIESFEDVLDSCVLHWDIDTTIDKVIVPFLEKTELLSYNDKSCETHFAVTAIRRKIILGIEKVKTPPFNGHTALLFLAEGEHYDLLLLYMAYQLKRRGIRVLYLGTNVPLENLKQMIAAKKPNLLYTYIPQRKTFKLHSLIPFLAQPAIRATLLVATSELVHLQQNMANVRFFCYREVTSALGEYANK